ncbi:MAG: hypothetical protein HQ539_01165 [Parcubacteria group bacterium]|nr:hypothetical protein [Parcubacteria group bacterium]
MPGVKKIDYRELGKSAQQTPQETPQGETAVGSPQQEQETIEIEKVSFFSSLATKWGMMDKKIKVEFILFIIIIGLTIISMAYYFSKTRVPKIQLTPEELSLPEENEPPDTAPEYEYLVPEL